MCVREYIISVTKQREADGEKIVTAHMTDK